MRGKSAKWARGNRRSVTPVLRIAGSNVERARSLDHALSLCTALGQAACPVALLNGDLASAESFVEALLAESAKKDAAHEAKRAARKANS